MGIAICMTFDGNRIEFEALLTGLGPLKTIQNLVFKCLFIGPDFRWKLWYNPSEILALEMRVFYSHFNKKYEKGLSSDQRSVFALTLLRPFIYGRPQF